MKKSIIMGLFFAMMVFPIISLGLGWSPLLSEECTKAGGRWNFETNKCSPLPRGAPLLSEECTKAGGRWNFKINKCSPLPRGAPLLSEECTKAGGRWNFKINKCSPLPILSGGGGDYSKKEYPVNKAGVAVQGFPSVEGAGDSLYEANGTVLGGGGALKCVLNKETGSVECTSESCSFSTTEYRRINPKTGKPMPTLKLSGGGDGPKFSGGGGGVSGSTR